MQKKIYHDGFLRADRGRAKICCQMGQMGCAFWQVAQKAIVRIQFLAFFLQSTHQVDMKNVVKCSKHFLGYFNTLETQGEND